MVMRTVRVHRGGKVPGSPASRGHPNGSARSIDHLGSPQNGGSLAKKEEKENTRLDGYPGVKRDGQKTKPLSSLDSNRVVKRSPTPTKHSSLKVVLGLTGTEKALSSSVKENIEDIPSDYSLAHEQIKQRCSKLDEDSEESNNDSNLTSKRRKKTIHYSPSQNAEAIQCPEEGELPLFPESFNQNDTISNTLNVHTTLKAIPPTSWPKSVQDISCTTATLSVAPSLPRDQTTSNFVSSQVNALSLFERSDSLKTMGEVIAGHNNDGLSLLGAAAFLSLGLDETSIESAKKSNCTDSPIECSNDDSKRQAIGIVINMACSVTDNTTAHGTVKQSSPVLGADLTLGLPMDVAEKSERCQNIIKVNGEVSLPLDELGNTLKTSQALEPGNFITHLDKIVNFGRQSVSEPQLRSEVSPCALNTDPQIIDDCLSRKDTVNEDLVGHMGTGRDCMHFSDLSIPLRGTLLLPRGQKRARRFPVQFKRLKSEVLQQKKEVVKKESVSKFSRVTAPSGLLADLNPGIINRVRNSKQVHAIIEAVVGPDVLTAYEDSKQNYILEPKINQQQRTFGISHLTAKVDNDFSEVVDMHNGNNDLLNTQGQLGSVEGLKWKLEERMTTAMDACASAHLQSEERFTDASLLDEAFECLDARADLIPPIECDRDQFYLNKVVGEHCNMKGTFNCHCHYCHPGESSGTDSTCSASLSRKAATMASYWLELYYQDVKGRLAALKRSRKRVRAVIKEVFSYASLDPTSASHDNNKLFGKVSNNDQHASMFLSAERDHVEKWRSLFIHMDQRLNVEGTQLETSLQQIKGMQAHCKWGLQEAQTSRPGDHQEQQPERLEDKHRSKVASGKTIERQYAVGAAAASIYSTANFVTTSEDFPCF